ncbi:sporulation protein YabP [Bacillaceae bacterium W0354]
MQYEPNLYRNENDRNREHDLKLVNRKRLDITGVKDVDSFDTEEFLLETTLGFLVIRGQNLHMKNLNVDEGKLTIQGRIETFSYIDDHQNGKAKGFFSKLFK